MLSTEFQTKIQNAIQKKSLDLLKEALNEPDADLTLVHKRGETLLHIAITQSEEMFQFVLDHLKKTLPSKRVVEMLHTKDSDGLPPLYRGLQLGRTENCKALLASQLLDKTSFTMLDDRLGNILHHTAHSDRNIEILPLLFQQFKIFGIDPLEFDSQAGSYYKSATPFMLASEEGQSQIAIALFRHGLARLIHEPTHLHLAARAHNLGVVNFLIEEQKSPVNVNEEYYGTPLHIAAKYFTDHPAVFFTLFQHSDVNLLKRYDTACHIILENLNPYNRQFIESNIHLILNDPRFDVVRAHDRHSLLSRAVSQDSIVIFKLVLERLQAKNEEYKVKLGYKWPAPEVDLKGFVAHFDHGESPQIKAYYAALSVLKENQNFTCGQVFSKLQQENFPEHDIWTEKHKLTAFYHAQSTLGLISKDLFALLVFLSDDYLRLKTLDENASEDVLKAQKFFRFASKFSDNMDVQMVLCNRADRNRKSTISGNELVPAFQSLALAYPEDLEKHRRKQKYLESIDKAHTPSPY